MEVVIVPVAHVSKESVHRVREAIATQKPDVVAIELDAQRLHALTENAKPGFRDLLKHPFLALLYFFQQAIGSGLKISPGSEMLEAVRAARDEGVPIALVDRPIGMTMGRLSSIPLKEKLSIAFQLLLAPIAFLPNPFSGKKVDFDEVAREGLPKEFFEEFKKRLPKTYKVLVDERDDYIFDRVSRIKAGKVVLVVGAGHLPGIKKRIEMLRVANYIGFAS